MKNLVKISFFVLVLFSFSGLKAQISGGLGLVYGSNINNIGITLNGNYEFNEQWSAAPTFTYFFKKDYISWSALDLDVNYQFSGLDNVGKLYAIGGLNMTFYKWDYDLGVIGYDGTVTGSEVGLNLGIGLSVPVSEKMLVAPEIKYTVGGANYLRIGAKVMLGF
jgi:hypothetical protein